MSNTFGSDGAAPAGETRFPAADLRIAARRRALKALLGSAPVVFTFPFATAAAASFSCQDDLNNAKQTSPPNPISDTDMATPAWFRLVVTKQIYDPGGKILYKYDTGSTIRYYEPPNYTPPLDSVPESYTLQSETSVYVLADISKQPPEPDFTGAGFNSTMSCMASMP